MDNLTTTNTPSVGDHRSTQTTEVQTRVLPDGMEITFFMDPATWPGVGETAFVPRCAVLVDPHQPRDTGGITETEDHKQFAQSIGRHGQGMIMRVRLLTPEERNEEKGRNPLARYRIEDGERRWHATGPEGANLDYLQITVIPPREGRDTFLSQVVLNTMQKKLNTPDTVRALLKIKRDFEVNASQLARMVSMQQSFVNDLLHMGNLAPDILELTNREKYSKGKGLANKPAVALSKIGAADGLSAHERQQALLKEAEKRKIRGAKQLEVFFESYHSEQTRAHAQKRQPKRRRNRLDKLLAFVLEHDLLGSDGNEILRITATASQGEIEALCQRAQQAALRFADLHNHLKTAARHHSSHDLGRIDEKRMPSNGGDGGSSKSSSMLDWTSLSKKGGCPSPSEQKKLGEGSARSKAPPEESKTPDGAAAGQQNARKDAGKSADSVTRPVEPKPQPPPHPIMRVKPNTPTTTSRDGFTPFAASVWDDKLVGYALKNIETPEEVLQIADAGGFENGVPSSVDLEACRRWVAEQQAT